MYPIISSLFISISILFSQNIETIKIEGNKKTRDYIILREIAQEVNTKFNETNLIEDENRIYNLGLFSSVDIQIIESTYLITVSEMWYIWPFPIIKYDNKSEKISYGAGINHNNFRGRDTNIALGATVGNIREYFLWYENPWISGDHNSLEMGIYNESSNHHVYNILEKDKGFFTSGGFYKGYNHKFDFGFNYNNKLIKTIDNSESDKDILELDNLTQTDFTYIRLGFEYRYDSRDIYVDPSSGIFFNIELNSLFGLDEMSNMYSIVTDYNIYKTLYEDGLENPILRYRLLSKTQYSSSDLPIFKKEYIGGQGYVRGYYANPSENCKQNSCILGSQLIDNPKNLIEVDNFFINTFEIQNTVIKRKEYFPEVEMGLDFVFFADWGVGYNINKSIDLNNSLFGYGVGLRIFLMGGVIKLDYGFNFQGTSRVHLF